MKTIIQFQEGAPIEVAIKDFSIELDQINPLHLNMSADYENQSLETLKEFVDKKVAKISVTNEEEEIVYESEEWKEISRLTINYHPGYGKMVINFTFGM